MNSKSRHTLARTSGIPALLLASALFALPGWGEAQVGTTSSLVGRISTPLGNPLQNVEIVVMNTATGSQRTTASQLDGRYVLQGIQPGGPYRIEARALGYRTEALPNLFFSLGQTERVDFVLIELVVALQGIDVVGMAPGALLSRTRTGPGTVLPREVLLRSPTTSRDLSDFVRLTPQVSVSGRGVVAAGRNPRYNQAQIDGHGNQDLLGGSDSGMPGGVARARPLPLEAIQEIQVDLAPFDVRQSGFTGAHIQTLTRSGTDRLEGALFVLGTPSPLVGNYRDPVWTRGRSPSLEGYEHSEFGGAVGGPLVRGRAHFFLAGERSSRAIPSPGVVGGNAGPSEGDLLRVAEHLRSAWGLDLGIAPPPPLRQTSDNFFARVDLSLSPRHRLSLRHNRVFGEADERAGGVGPDFSFPGSESRSRSRSHSTFAQLHSELGKLRGGQLLHEFRLGWVGVRDQRRAVSSFPHLNMRGEGGTSIQVGADGRSSRTSLEQNIFEGGSEFSWARPGHGVTLGIQLEAADFSKLWLPDLLGSWRFDSVDAFLAGQPSEYRATQLRPGEDGKVDFPVRRWSLYLQDRWEPTPSLALTLGGRVEWTHLPERPRISPLLELGQAPEGAIPAHFVQWSPRLGFNWDVGGGPTTRLRGGVGVFSGRPPYAWIASAYANNGLESLSFRCRGIEAPRFSVEPPASCAGDEDLPSVSLQTVDPDFLPPQIWRTSLALDRELPWLGSFGTLEALHTRTIQDLQYRDLRISPDPEASVREGRSQVRSQPLLGSNDLPGLAQILNLTQTEEGYTWALTAQIQRPIQAGWGFQLAYTLSEARDVNGGAFRSDVADWHLHPTPSDPNHPPLARSVFLVRERALAAVSVDLPLLPSAPTALSLVWIGESGAPYSYVYRGDVNGDRVASNDLVYVPASPSEIWFEDPSGESGAASWAALNAWIEAEDCLRAARGRIVERGACRAPGFHQVDIRLSQEIPSFGGRSATLSLDLRNAGNLLNSSWGRRTYVPGEAVEWLLVSADTESEGGRVRMAPFGPWKGVTRVEDLASRYQLQLGIRHTF